MKKITFVFLYEFLKLGGIEKNVVDLIRVYSKMGIRIVWLRYGKEEDIYEPWKKVLADCQVEIIETCIKEPYWFKTARITFDEDEEVIAVAFDPMDFVRLEMFAHQYNNRVSIYYIVPHFERNLNYVEEYYLRNKDAYDIINRLSPIYQKWYDNGNLLFFSDRHVVEMKKRYNLKCKNVEARLFKTPIESAPFDYQLAQKRSERKEFRIITCGRFDFPHKGYMFGLIDAYAALKEQYSSLKLDIVGYGIGDDDIRKYASKYADYITKDISFLGAVSPEQMKDFFDRAHVNVSVAGGLIDGAKTGLVSLPARHYTYDCEVYGWLDGDLTNVVSDRPGEDVKQYICELINMDAERYIDLCKKSYDTCNNNDCDPYWLLEQNNIMPNYYSEKEISLFRKINKYKEKKERIKGIVERFIKPVLNKLGVYQMIKKIWDNIRKRQRKMVQKKISEHHK